MNKFPEWVEQFYVPHDRVFSAYSSNGIDWKRDKGVRLEKNKFNPFDGSFYCFIHQPDDLHGLYELFYHASVQKQDRWVSHIIQCTSLDLKNWNSHKNFILSSDQLNNGLTQIRAPFLKKVNGFWRLYFTAKSTDGIPGIYSAISTSREKWEIEPGMRISSSMCMEETTFNEIVGVSDTSIIDLPDGSYRMYFSVYRGSIFKQNICSATSIDGLHWRIEPGIRLNFGSEGCRLIVNNPSVIKINGLWNMFFRGSNNMPIKDKIFRAVSDDSLEWNIIEPVISPNPYNLKERHEVAHPFVFKTNEGIYRMFYTGCGGTILDRFAYKYYEEQYKKMGISILYD